MTEATDDAEDRGVGRDRYEREKERGGGIGDGRARRHGLSRYMTTGIHSEHYCNSPFVRSVSRVNFACELNVLSQVCVRVGARGLFTMQLHAS